MPHISEYHTNDGLWVKIKGYWYEIAGTQPGPLRDGFIVMVPAKLDGPKFFALRYFPSGGFEILEDFCANPEIVRECSALLAQYFDHPDTTRGLARILESDPPAWRWARDFPISLECPLYMNKANLYKDSGG